MNETLESLKAAYSKATTHKERAELELKCWERFRGSSRLARHEFLAETLGQDRYHIRARLTILGYGEKASKLWGPLENGMSLTGAISIYTAAKTNKLNEPLEHALERELSKWISSGEYPARAENKGSGLAAERERELSFRKNIAEICRTYVSEKLVGFDDFEKNSEIEWFERELKVIFEQFYNRVRSRDHRSGDSQPSRRGFLEACRVLRVDPPKKFSAEWKRRVAQPQMKRMAREYHPDQTKGATEPQFNSVMEAWRVIDQYGENGDVKT